MLKLFTRSRKQSVTNNVNPGEIAPPPSMLQSEAYWGRRRRPQLEHESKLSGWTRSWLEALPEHLHPAHLGSCHPHVANRLALSWRDPVLTERVFDDLLVDRRTGRKGFSPPVLAELLRLREHHDHRRGVTRRPALGEPCSTADPNR
jgi:hypothetical protein